MPDAMPMMIPLRGLCGRQSRYKITGTRSLAAYSTTPTSTIGTVTNTEAPPDLLTGF
jgi:hypothetical protein